MSSLPQTAGRDYASRRPSRPQPVTPPADYPAAGDDQARWPHLWRPAPQPHNQIAGTLEEQITRAHRPRPPVGSPTLAQHQRLTRRVAALERDAADALRAITARVQALEGRSAGRGGRR
ncbi:MAG TPA: hypothetical protein VFG68_22100 [Fimbriiglobus sp.]|nr:hypothetical protein [Fimbriiglobus sp.]